MTTKVSIWLYLHYLTLLYVPVETHLSINVFSRAVGVFLRAAYVHVVGLMTQLTIWIYIWYIMEHKMCSIGLVHVCLIKIVRLFEKCRDVFIKDSKIRGLKIKKGQVRVNIKKCKKQSDWFKYKHKTRSNDLATVFLFCTVI